MHSLDIWMHENDICSNYWEKSSKSPTVQPWHREMNCFSQGAPVGSKSEAGGPEGKRTGWRWSPYIYIYNII